MLIPAPVDQNMDHLFSEPNSEEPPTLQDVSTVLPNLVPIKDGPCSGQQEQESTFIIMIL